MKFIFPAVLFVMLLAGCNPDEPIAQRLDIPSSQLASAASAHVGRLLPQDAVARQDVKKHCATTGMHPSCGKEEQQKLAGASVGESLQPDTFSLFPNDDAVYTACDEPAMFPRGPVAMVEFINRTLQYPPAAKNAGSSGIVYVSFIVEKNGALSSFEVVKSPDQQLSDEALRVLKLMPAWTPAKQSGRPARMRITLPVRFAQES